MTLQPRPKIFLPGYNKLEKVVRLGSDFETYCDLSLPDVGADAYSRHKSCDVLMLAYKFNDESIEQWVPPEFEFDMPARLEDALLDERVIKTAWNAPFEYSVYTNTLGMTLPRNSFRCTMALAYTLSLPGKLEKAGEVVEIAEDQKKSAEGRALMRVFSFPRKPTKTKLHTRTHWWMEPEKWERYKAYNRLDVAAEYAILRKLLRFDMPREEWELWVIDQEINQAGIPMNMKAVDAACKLYDHVMERQTDRLKEITGLANPASTQQLLPWLQNHGYPFEDCKKGHIETAADQAKKDLLRLEADAAIEAEAVPDTGDESQDGALAIYDQISETAALAEVLDIRRQTSRSSPKKYFALQRAVDRIGMVLRNAFQFAGAGRTWRWSGRMFQPQNLPRPERAYKKIIDMVVLHLEKLDPEAIELIYENPMDLLVSCIRSVAQAPDGYVFVDADLNAIENRVLGWIAKDKKILRVFELKRDPYIEFATYMYHQPYDVLMAEHKAGHEEKRTVAKPGVLGCGYGLGVGEERVNRKTGEIEATGLLGYAWNMKIKLTREQADLSVTTFRETYEDVVESWKQIEKAAKRCVITGKMTEYHMIRFEMKAPFLIMRLPSGRPIHYCRPRIDTVKTPWGAMREQITYEGQNDQNQWVRISTHGSKLIENADQAIARDLLGNALKLAYYRGMDLRIHVHDQAVALAPEDEAEHQLQVLQECLGEPPEWSTHEGVALPLGSAGHISKIFKKD